MCLPGDLVGGQRPGDVFRLSDRRKVGQEGGDARTAVGGRATKAYQEEEKEEEKKRQQVGNILLSVLDRIDAHTALG